MSEGTRDNNYDMPVVAVVELLVAPQPSDNQLAGLGAF